MVSPPVTLTAGNRPPRLERSGRGPYPHRPRTIPFRLLHEATSALNASGLDVSAIADTACRLVVDHFQGGAIIGVSDERGDLLTPVAARHHVADTMERLRDQIIGNRFSFVRDQTTAEGGSSLPVSRSAISIDLPLDDLSDRIDLPLTVGGRSIGLLVAFRCADEPMYSLEVFVLLRELADRAAPLIENALLHQRLLEKEQRLTTLVDQVLMAQEVDRRRVAYDIHDGLAQIATSVYQHLEAFAGHHAWEPGEQIELERTQLLARRAIREARRVIAQLRPTVLDDFGLSAALAEEIDGLRALGLDITFEDSTDDLRLSRAAAVAIFRIAQEALTNARKYAGPTPIRVSLIEHDERLRLEVEDSGRGFDSSIEATRTGPGERVGLAGIRERMTLLGGTCSIWSQPGVGTRIAVELPLAADKGESQHVDTHRAYVTG